MAEKKGVALAVLGVVSVLAIVGLVLLFTKAGATGQVSSPYAKLYTRSSIDPVAYPYPYLQDRTAGGVWYPYTTPYQDWDKITTEEQTLPWGTTLTARYTSERGLRQIPSIQTCALGSGEPGEIPCPVYRGMQSICFSRVRNAQARFAIGWIEVPGAPGCGVPKPKTSAWT